MNLTQNAFHLCPAAPLRPPQAQEQPSSASPQASAAPQGLSHFPYLKAEVTGDDPPLLRLSVNRQRIPQVCALCRGGPDNPCIHTHPMRLAEEWLRTNGWRLRNGSARHDGEETRRYYPPGQHPSRRQPSQ